MTEFESYRQQLLRERFSASVMLMAIPLYLSFSILDWLYAPDLWILFLKIRVVSCFMFGLAAYLLSKNKSVAVNNIILLSHLITATLGIGIGYMTHKTGGLISPYYAGLNWITIGSLAFWPIRPEDRVVSIATIYVPVFLFVPFELAHFTTPTALLSIVFMVGTCFLALVSNLLSTTSLRREFDFRGELKDLIRDKDVIIEKKSIEMADLKRLAKQFSPAVIEAIASKTIDLDQRERKFISIIFIDVVGSTSHANRVNHEDYQKALDLFFDLAIKKLLKRNITVANFMGDGLMAIVNAPYAVLGHEKIAFEAALEILYEIKKEEAAFTTLWKDKFHIRIGISAGEANVGFFPNTDFGVYTAIGDVVNLAARLCQSAENSTVATTKNFVKLSGGSSQHYLTKQAGTIAKFKGFEEYNTNYYLTSPLTDPNQILPNSVCPLCSSEVRQVSDLGDCIIIKCVSCNYSDINPKAGGFSSAA